jgi:uncharacterized membrane protein required for colicin V production
MLLDILISVPLIIFMLLGVRDGVVRKLVAIAVIILGLFLGQTYMQSVGTFLSSRKIIDAQNAPMYGYLIIFLGLFIVQALLYRLLTKGYKIGGIADRIAGGVIGFLEGMLFISSMLVILSLSGFPDRETKRDTRFYKAVVNIAPQILDLSNTLSPENFMKKQIESSK